MKIQCQRDLLVQTLRLLLHSDHVELLLAKEDIERGETVNELQKLLVVLLKKENLDQKAKTVFVRFFAAVAAIGLLADVFFR